LWLHHILINFSATFTEEQGWETWQRGIGGGRDLAARGYCSWFCNIRERVGTLLQDQVEVEASDAGMEAGLRVAGSF